MKLWFYNQVNGLSQLTSLRAVRPHLMMANTQWWASQLAQRTKNKHSLPRLRKASSQEEDQNQLKKKLNYKNQRRILPSRQKKSLNSTETNSKREIQARSPPRIFIRKSSKPKKSRIPTIPTLPTIPNGCHVIERKISPLFSIESLSPHKGLNPVRSGDIAKIKNIPTPGGAGSDSDSSIRRLIILS